MNISIIAIPAQSGVKSIAVQCLAVLPRLAKHQIGRISERRQMRRDAYALRALDDRILADIGLHRCEVEYAVRYGRQPRG